VVGYLINGYNVSDLNRVLHSFSYPLVGTAYILDGSGLVLYASDLSDAGIIPGFFSGISGTPWDTNRINGNIYNVIYNRDYDFYTVGKIPEAELFKNVRARNLSILAISIVSAAIAILLTLLSTWSLKRRVKNITKTMTVAETGDLSVRAKVSTYDDELDRISSGLNSMIININEHINTEYLSELRRKNAELRQREAELSALQSEVNPHFLYNTLESIRMQAVLNKDQDTAVLIRLLANLFRNRIKNGTVVKINDELVYCKSLIEILSARYGGDIDISLDIPKEIEEYGILRDLLQPILENAFIHGFSEEYEREKRLSISGVIEQGVINLRVQNSGKSIEKEKLRRIRDYIEYHDSATEDGNIGLLNVHQRIHLVYGEGYGVYINSDEERGTTVGIKIQALTVEQLKEMIS
jgi:two-component system sensor histidine kinase YesM